MKKVFNKLTKVLLLISIVISQFAPSVMVFANTSAGIAVSASNDGATYTDITNNSSYTFDQTTSISNYYYKLDGTDFESTEKYLLRSDIDFYGLWDLNTKVNSTTFVKFVTGDELNNVLSYTIPYNQINANNGKYDINLSTYKLSDISIGGSTLDSKTSLELDALKNDIIALDMTSYTKQSANSFSINVTNLESGFVIDKVENYDLTDLTVVENVYQFDYTNTDFRVKYHYNVASFNPSEAYHINVYKNGLLYYIVKDLLIDDLDDVREIYPDFDLSDGNHSYEIRLFDSNDNMVDSKVINFNISNSPINIDLNTYFTIDNTIKSNYPEFFGRICNYKVLSEENKLLLLPEIKEEMDKYELEFSNLDFDRNLNTIITSNNFVVNSFFKVKSETKNIMSGVNGSFDKESIAVPNNVLVGDFRNDIEDLFKTNLVINSNPFENKNLKVKVFDINEEEVLDTDYLQTGMKVEFNLFSHKLQYYVVVKGNIVSDNGLIKTDDIREAINLAINASNLSNVYYAAADVNGDEKVDVLDTTEMIYVLNNNNNDNTFTDFENNTIAPTITDDINISLDTKAKGTRVGDTFKIDVLISGLENDTINGIEGLLNYNKDLIKCNSVELHNNWIGNINVINDVDYGKFMYAGTNQLDSDTAILTFTFEALSKGEAKISISNLKSALNGYEITLNNTDDKTNELNVKIDRALSSNANIKSLTYNKGWLKQSFDKNNLTHILYVDYRVDSITLSGTLEDSNAKTDSFKEYTLDSYKTIIPLTVTAENGSIKTYNIEVIKVDTRSSNNNLKSLEIKNVDLIFNKDILEYSFTVDSSVKELDITAIAEKTTSSVSITGDTKLKTGLNEISIKVTAENGDTKEYVLKVTKEKEKVKEEVEEEEKGNSKLVLIILIVATICGLLYLVFKDNDESNKTVENFKEKEKTQPKKNNNSKK